MEEIGKCLKKVAKLQGASAQADTAIEKINEIVRWVNNKEEKERQSVRELQKLFPKRRCDKKVGDIVYHKTNAEMPMVIYELDDQDNVWCSWWNGVKFEKDCFIPKELLFDGEQQQKPKAGGKDGS